MKGFITREEFVNLFTKGERFQIEGAAKRVFGDAEWAISHFFAHQRDTYGKQYRRLDQTLIDEFTAFSYLAGTLNGNPVYYVGFGSDLWSYACAKTTGKIVIAIDPSRVAHEYADIVASRCGRLSNLEHRRTEFSDIVGQLDEEDTLFVVGCQNNKLRKEMIEAANSKRTNLQMGIKQISIASNSAVDFNEAYTYAIGRSGLHLYKPHISRSNSDPSQRYFLFTRDDSYIRFTGRIIKSLFWL